MADKTGIGWTNATWNPVRGCERVSLGCVKCYAEELAARHSYPGGWGEHLAKWVTRPDGSKEARWTGVIQTVDRMLAAPLKWREPRRIFVNSMSDLFHDRVPAEFVAEVFAVMADAKQHVFQILTKRPERMLQLLEHDLPYEGPEWPLPNVWLGVSVENQEEADKRIPLLLKTPAAVRFISAEPLLAAIDLEYPKSLFQNGPKMCCDGRECGCMGLPVDPPLLHGLNWGIVGGESGQGFRPMEMADARGVIAQFQRWRVPTFVKQDNGPRPGMRGRFTAEEWALKEYPA